MTSILIDTETLDLKPTSIITEIAAIAFTMGEDGTPTVTDHLDLRPDFWEQLAAGRTVDPVTVCFHRANGTLPEIRNEHLALIEHPHLPCIEVITALASFIREHKPRHVWIQGTDFDRPLIENFCQWLGQPLPWKYSISRDSRTTWSLAFPGQHPAKRPHKALEDCQATLADLTAALTKLNALASI